MGELIEFTKELLHNQTYTIGFDIIRCFGEALKKRFRPGLYQYDGNVQRSMPAKNKDKNNNNNKNTKNQSKTPNPNTIQNANQTNYQNNNDNNNDIKDESKPFRWSKKQNQLGTWVCYV